MDDKKELENNVVLKLSEQIKEMEIKTEALQQQLQVSRQQEAQCKIIIVRMSNQIYGQ